MQKIGFIGVGNMAYALISGLISHGFDKSYIKISDTNSALLSHRAAEFEVEIFNNNTTLAQNCEVIVLAVKPQILSLVCKQLQAHISHNPLIISIAAGVKTIDINRWLGGNATIVRVMPNTPALVGQGMAGMVANDAVKTDEKTLVEQIFSAVGEYVWVTDEKMLDAVTALSGSGPAYFFLMIESMTNTGVALGLDQPTAEKLSVQTALGASIMADKNEDSARQLRAKVTSKNGTTQAAIESFQDQNFESIISHAMRAAFDRARAMGAELSNDD